MKLAAAALLIAVALTGCDADVQAPRASDAASRTPTVVPTTPSSPSTDEPPSRNRARIAADFPLASGWPQHADAAGRGLRGPDRTLPSLELAPCGAPADDPAFADRLRADWSDIEDSRSRQLTTYRTDAGAKAALRAIVEAYRGCPEHETDEMFTTHFALEETAYGDESWSVAATETQGDGYPTSYLDVLHFIRVGRAVLVTTDAGEGGAAQPRMLAQLVAEPATDAAAVIEAMCVFSRSRCTPVRHRLVVDEHGIGPIRLGLDRDDLDRLGARFSDGGFDCEAFVVRYHGVRVEGQIDPEAGVSIIYFDDWGETPEHVGTDTTTREFRAAYPGWPPGRLFGPITVGVPGGAKYVFRFDLSAPPYRIYVAGLMTEDQNCTVL